MALLISAWIARAIWVQRSYQAHSLPPALQSQNLLIRGKILKIHSVTKFNYNVDMEVEHCDSNAWNLPATIRLSWFIPTHQVDGHSIFPGQIWQLMVRLKWPRDYYNPGNRFSIERQFFEQNVVAKGYVYLKFQPRCLEASVFNTEALRHRIWQYFQERTTPALAGRILIAVLLGYRQGLSEAEKLILSETGTAHLMAISGLHVGIVAGVLFFLCKYLKLASAGWTNWVTILGAWLYALISGFGLPAQRAALMLTLGLGSRGLGHFYYKRDICGLTFFLVLILQPFAFLNMGFWLSFLAVGVLLLGTKSRLKNPSMVRIQYLTFIGMLPFGLLFFKQITWISPLANLIAIPWFGLFVVPLSFLGLLLSGIWPVLGAILIKMAECHVHFLWLFLSYLQQQCSSWVWNLPHVSSWHWMGLSLAVLLLILPEGLYPRSLSVLILGPIFLWPNSFNAKSDSKMALKAGDFKFWVLDVGQGLSGVVETQHHCLLYDAGPKAAGTAMVQFFKDQDMKKIDGIVLSHGDADHTGGLFSIMATGILDERSLSLASEPARTPYFWTQHCQSGQSWEWDGVKFEILHPEQTVFFKKQIARRKHQNNDSCVLKISSVSQGKSFLLTGDIGLKTEKFLIQALPEQLKTEVLVAPHHGSKHSSSELFIEQVKPKHVIFSSGYLNPWSMPHRSIVDRYLRQGAEAWETVKHGAVHGLVQEGKITLKSYRHTADRDTIKQDNAWDSLLKRLYTLGPGPL